MLFLNILYLNIFSCCKVDVKCVKTRNICLKTRYNDIKSNRWRTFRSNRGKRKLYGKGR